MYNGCYKIQYNCIDGLANQLYKKKRKKHAADHMCMFYLTHDVIEIIFSSLFHL
jgi:hypothetical protein